MGFDRQGLRTISQLGSDDRLREKPIARLTSQRPQIGQIGKVQFGQHKIIEMAPTLHHYGEFTKCIDGADSINCVARLVDSKKVFLVPNGTRVQVLEFRDNPLHPSILKGQLIQCRIFEGAFRGQAMWTLENRVVR
jgi:hypothetical protein